MKTLFEIQTESGQLWLDIKEHLDAKDAEIVTLTTKEATAAARLQKLLTAAQDALAAGDFDSLKAILFPAVEEEKLTERERQLAALDAEIAAKQAERDKLATAEVGEVAEAKA